MKKFTKYQAGTLEFSDHYSKIVICYKRKGYNIDVKGKPDCLAVNQISVDPFAYIFNRTPVGGDQTQ